jgi:hypothetical protein
MRTNTFDEQLARSTVLDALERGDSWLLAASDVDGLQMLAMIQDRFYHDTIEAWQSFSVFLLQREQAGVVAIAVAPRARCPAAELGRLLVDYSEIAEGMAARGELEPLLARAQLVMLDGLGDARSRALEERFEGWLQVAAL